MGKSHCDLVYHIVFSTKYRSPWLARSIRSSVFAYLEDIVRRAGGQPLIINGVSDHVHCLVRLRQDMAVSDMVRTLKAKSSGWIHRTMPHFQSFAWQEGYGAFTVCRQHVRRVYRYILNQEAHHRHRAYRDEFVVLLRRHQIEYDARYIWD